MATNRQISNLITVLMFVLLAGINAAFTALFGAQFGAAMFPLQTSTMSQTAGAIAHLILLDFAALGWFMARTRDNTSATQRAVATVLAVASIGGSIMASLTHLAITTTLVDLSPARPTIGMAAFITIVTMAGLHFVGLFLWRFFDPDYRELDGRLERAARLADYRQSKQNELLGAVMGQVEQTYQAQVAAMAQREAAAMWAHMENALALPVGGANGRAWVVAVDGVETWRGTNEAAARAVMAGAIRHGQPVRLMCDGAVVESHTAATPLPAASANGAAGK